MNKSVLLGLSGGVDSAVSGYLLTSQGYHVEGAYCVMSERHLTGIEAAQRTASELGIKLHILDLQKEFNEQIIKPFCDDYNNGLTPSPCVICNPLVKFKSLLEKADALELTYISTGHYAKVLNESSGYTIACASDIKRDQSYMLYRLTQAQLSRLILPLEGYSKSAIREIAMQQYLTNHDQPDSEENCFIPDKNYTDYLARVLTTVKPGNFILPNGDKLPHKGVFNYTIGQRSGLGISYKEPLYVKQILENGDIMLCVSGEEFASEIIIKDTIINPNYPLFEGMYLKCKVRSAATPQDCMIRKIDEDQITVFFPDRVRAPAPGQSAVMYLDGKITMGGIISSTI